MFIIIRNISISIYFVVCFFIPDTVQYTGQHRGPESSFTLLHATILALAPRLIVLEKHIHSVVVCANLALSVRHPWSVCLTPLKCVFDTLDVYVWHPWSVCLTPLKCVFDTLIVCLTPLKCMLDTHEVCAWHPRSICSTPLRCLFDTHRYILYTRAWHP